METVAAVFAIMFAVALTNNRPKLSEQNRRVAVAWNHHHRLELRDDTIPATLNSVCLTKLARFRRPLIEALAAEFPPDSIERQLLAIALQGRPDALVRFAEILPPSEDVCIEAGGTFQGEGGESVCSVCGQVLAEFDEDLKEAAAEDEYADLAFEMAREERLGGDDAE